MIRRPWLTAALALVLGACGLPWVDDEWPSGCPDSVTVAESADVDAAVYLGVGSVIRFVDSPDPTFRGYDIAIDRTISGRHFLDTAFLRIDLEVAGIEPGQAVLVVALRPGPEPALTPTACPPLVPLDD